MAASLYKKRRGGTNFEKYIAEPKHREPAVAPPVDKVYAVVSSCKSSLPIQKAVCVGTVPQIAKYLRQIFKSIIGDIKADGTPFSVVPTYRCEYSREFYSYYLILIEETDIIRLCQSQQCLAGQVYSYYAADMSIPFLSAVLADGQPYRAGFAHIPFEQYQPFIQEWVLQTLPREQYRKMKIHALS